MRHTISKPLATLILALAVSPAAAGDVRGVYDATRGNDIRIFPNLSPYEERSLSHPYNPGPQFIFAPIPKNVTHHKNLHLPDPTCLAGCYPGKSKME